MSGIVLGLASGVVEAAYFILLAAAYKRGDLSVVYPVARGTAPLIAVAIGVVVFGERLGVAGSIGVIALLAGFLWLQRPWRAIAVARSGGAEARAAAADSAILFALATGVMIATYTAIDRLGTRQIDVLTYAAILWLTCSVVLVAWVWLVAGGDLLRYGPDASRRAAVGGLPDARCVPVHPRRAQRGAAVGRGAAARVGDGLRRGVGLGPAGRGGRPGRGRAPRRGVGADRRRGAAARGRQLRVGCRAPQAASIGGTRPNSRRRPNRLLTSPTPAMTSAVPMMIRASTGSWRTR